MHGSEDRGQLLSFICLEMAIFPTRVDQSANVAYTLGGPYHGNRIPFRFRRRVLLHFPSLALLDQPRYRGDPYGIRRDT